MIQIYVGQYPIQWSRRDPWGLFLPSLIEGRNLDYDYIVEASMEGDGFGPYAIKLLKAHEEFRGISGKPRINGKWWPLLKLKTIDGYTVAMQRGSSMVMVNTDTVPSLPPSPPLVPFQFRAIFYYPWFFGGWDIYPIKYIPSLGYYDQTDPKILTRHIDCLVYAKCDVGIISWWGQNHFTDGMTQLILNASIGRNIKWAIYYEIEGTTNPSVEKIHMDLNYIRDKYASHPNFLKIDGRFVIFIYTPNDYLSCEIMERWRVFKEVYIVPGAVRNYLQCPSQPDGWHQYNPIQDTSTTWDIHRRLYSFSISPGFFNMEADSPRLIRDIVRFKRNIRDMVASQAPWQLITTFNEWIEGTSVESAVEWETSSGFGFYLDALHNDGV